MKRKKISKRGSAIIALLVVLVALAGSPAASAASWVGDRGVFGPDASWGEGI